MALCNPKFGNSYEHCRGLHFLKKRCRSPSALHGGVGGGLRAVWSLLSTFLPCFDARVSVRLLLQAATPGWVVLSQPILIWKKHLSCLKYCNTSTRRMIAIMDLFEFANSHYCVFCCCFQFTGFGPHTLKSLLQALYSMLQEGYWNSTQARDEFCHLCNCLYGLSSKFHHPDSLAFHYMNPRIPLRKDTPMDDRADT